MMEAFEEVTMAVLRLTCNIACVTISLELGKKIVQVVLSGLI